MAQLSLYMDETTMAGPREDAAERGMSISAYAREVLETRNTRDAAGWENGWPSGFFALYGSCPDFPEVEDLGFPASPSSSGPRCLSNRPR